MNTIEEVLKKYPKGIIKDNGYKGMIVFPEPQIQWKIERGSTQVGYTKKGRYVFFFSENTIHIDCVAKFYKNDKTEGEWVCKTNDYQPGDTSYFYGYTNKAKFLCEVHNINNHG